MINRFERIRKDHQLETAQDYVEIIYELITSQGNARVKDISKILGVSNVTVTKTIKRLDRDGYLSTEPYQPITLTKKGEELAKKSIKKHKIVYQFLVHLGVPPEIAEIDTEGIEHHISDVTLNILNQFIISHEKQL